MKRLHYFGVIVIFATVVLVGPGCEIATASQDQQWENSLKPSGKAAKQLTMALEGKTDYVIAVPSSATIQEQKAGEELRISNVEFRM